MRMVGRDDDIIVITSLSHMHPILHMYMAMGGVFGYPVLFRYYFHFIICVYVYANSSYVEKQASKVTRSKQNKNSSVQDGMQRSAVAC